MSAHEYSFCVHLAWLDYICVVYSYEKIIETTADGFRTNLNLRLCTLRCNLFIISDHQ